MALPCLKRLVLGAWAFGLGLGAGAQVPEQAWHTVLLTPQTMVAARRAAEQPWPGRAMLVQARSALRGQAGWQLAKPEWLAISCNGLAPSASFVVPEASGQSGWPAQAPQGVLLAPVAAEGAGPSGWYAVGAWACLAQGMGHAAQAQVADSVVQTGGLADVQAWSCALAGRSKVVSGDVKLGFSASAQALRLNDTWLPQARLTPDFWSFEQAGWVWRLVLQSGAMRVVSQEDGETVASGHCSRVPGYLPVNGVTGW